MLVKLIAGVVFGAACATCMACDNLGVADSTEAPAVITYHTLGGCCAWPHGLQWEKHRVMVLPEGHLHVGWVTHATRCCESCGPRAAVTRQRHVVRHVERRVVSQRRVAFPALWGY